MTVALIHGEGFPAESDWSHSSPSAGRRRWLPSANRGGAVTGCDREIPGVRNELCF